MRILGLEIRRVLKTKITLILLAAAMGLTFVMAYLPVTYVYTSYVDAQGNVIEVKRLLKILKEAEEFDADKEAWISLEELKEVVGV